MDNFVILSPVTHEDPSILVGKLDGDAIVDLYRTKLDMDVSRFYKGYSQIGIYECSKTGYRFYYPFSLAGDGPFYESKIEKKEYYSEWKNEYQSAIERIQELGGSRSVLDIGCGFGAFLQRLREIGADVRGLEFNKTAVSHCVQTGLDVSMESIESHSQMHNDCYDCVTVFQVLEHVVDVKAFLDAALMVLKPGGLLFIAVPNNEPFYAGYHNYAVTNVPPHHMGMWNKQSLLGLATHYGLNPLSFEYDNQISFAYYQLFRGRYLAQRVFRKPGPASQAFALLFSGLTLPLEIFRLRRTNSVLAGTVMVVLQKPQ